ncbi:MAG: GNAT family N-acetyltransferase [Planctomycetota bacterium]|nr:GNAT family N-acetyltransferase [Planctomycetota bacterium]
MLVASPWPGSRNWVVEEEGVIRGWASAGACRDEDLAAPEGAPPPDVVHELYAIYVDPDLVGHGYGRALMQHCVRQARTAGHREMVMWVLTGNERARHFYAAAGFVPDARRPATPFRDTGQTKMRLWRALGPS